LSDDGKEVEEEDEDAADEGNEGGNGESGGKCMPCDKSDWFFDGFWTFYVYGPYPNRRKCTVLGTGDLDAPKGTLSRAYAKKELASGGTSTRAKPPSPAKQAVEAQLCMSKASYAAQVSMEKGRDADRDIAYLTNQIELVKMQMKISLATKDLDELAELKVQMKTLSKEIEEKRANLMKRSVMPMFDEVGTTGDFPIEVGNNVSEVSSPLYASQSKKKKAKSSASTSASQSLSPLRRSTRSSPHKSPIDVTKTATV
jgi:hypothetical protein